MRQRPNCGSVGGLAEIVKDRGSFFLAGIGGAREGITAGLLGHQIAEVRNGLRGWFENRFLRGRRGARLGLPVLC
jgi:hypothetical protein